MKNIFCLLSICSMFVVACSAPQPAEKTGTSSSRSIQVEVEDAGFIGIWKVTEHNDPGAIEDVWEFQKDSIFNKLKPEEDGSHRYVADESGFWKYEHDTLYLTITGEMTNGVRKDYFTHQYLKFPVISKKDTILITTPKNFTKGKSITLRLTRKG